MGGGGGGGGGGGHEIEGEGQRRCRPCPTRRDESCAHAVFKILIEGKAGKH